MDRSSFDRVVALHNGKGGAKKTTLATNLSGVLAAADYRVLLIDLDQQGNCGEDLGYTDNPRNDHGQALRAALEHGTPLTPTLTARDNLDVIAGGAALRRFTVPNGQSPFDLLVEPLADLVQDYALVIVDTPPGGQDAIDAALGITRHLLIPCPPDRSSIKGLVAVADSMEAAQDRNPDLGLLGCILVDIPRSATRVRAQLEADLTQVLGGDDLLFRTTLRTALKPAEIGRRTGRLAHEQAADLRPPWEFLRAGNKVPDQAQSSAGLAQDCALITAEMLDRINALEALDETPASEAVADAEDQEGHNE